MLAGLFFVYHQIIHWQILSVILVLGKIQQGRKNLWDFLELCGLKLSCIFWGWYHLNHMCNLIMSLKPAKKQGFATRSEPLRWIVLNLTLLKKSVGWKRKSQTKRSENGDGAFFLGKSLLCIVRKPKGSDGYCPWCRNTNTLLCCWKKGPFKVKCRKHFLEDYFHFWWSSTQWKEIAMHRKFPIFDFMTYGTLWKDVSFYKGGRNQHLSWHAVCWMLTQSDVDLSAWGGFRKRSPSVSRGFRTAGHATTVGFHSVGLSDDFWARLFLGDGMRHQVFFWVCFTSVFSVFHQMNWDWTLGGIFKLLGWKWLTFLLLQLFWGISVHGALYCEWVVFRHPQLLSQPTSLGWHLEMILSENRIFLNQTSHPKNVAMVEGTHPDHFARPH